MTEQTKVGDLAGLLEQAGRAHHEAFVAADGDDPEWPLWYAEYLEGRIGKILDTPPTRSRLVQCLLNAEEEHASSGDDRPWHEFYASYILGLSPEATGPPPEPG